MRNFRLPLLVLSFAVLSTASCRSTGPQPESITSDSRLEKAEQNYIKDQSEAHDDLARAQYKYKEARIEANDKALKANDRLIEEQERAIRDAKTSRDRRNAAGAAAAEAAGSGETPK